MTANVTDIDFFTSYDRYEHYETPIPAQQRQQRTLRRSQASISPAPEHGQRSSTSSPLSHRGLRRTPRFARTPSPQNQPTFPSPPRRTHLEAVSVGIGSAGLFATADPKDLSEPDKRKERRRLVRKLNQDLLNAPFEVASPALPPSFIPPRTSSSPRSDRASAHPALHISKHTHSAILWALEEALRQPNSFTPDLIEENASMADFRGTGGQPAVTNGFTTATTRPTAPPAQTGSPSGIKGPRMIMQERQERERQRAERAAERERLERLHAETDARELDEQQRRMAERRAPAAGAATGAGMTSGVDNPSSRPLDPASAQRRQQQQQAVPPQAQQPAPRMQQPGPNQQRNTAQGQQPLQFSGVPNHGGAGGQMPGITGTQPGDNPATAKGQPRNTFPHAFERWEALSAHWEGLTSFWIRKLQQHADEIDRDPVSSQLSRQVSDLSAAGANLFHAVVELQRLRASSERKFQRWFFETRAELERNEETKAALERALAEERMSKANAIQEALENDRANSKTQKRIAEMQKELLISKEEARRAWEELGRREQEERDRTASLQQGLPTIVGGVQVVPMTQGVPGRGGSTREQRQPQQPDVPSQQYQYTQPPQVPATAAPSSGSGYYQQPQGADEEERPYSGEGGSEEGYSEGEYITDAHGNYIPDSRGDKVPHCPGTPGDDDSDADSDSGAEEYETPAAQPPVNYPPSSSPWTGGYSGQPDYSGGGYDAPGWESTPRHHHPTRLSDVLEEDETRSRTSAGQAHLSRI